MPAKPCIICAKFQLERDERGVCKKCQSAPGPISFARDGRNLLPVRNGLIVSREEWGAIRREVEQFYRYATDEKIDEENKKTKEQRRQAAESRIQGPATGYVYLLRASNGCHKIGRARDVEKRLKSILRDYPLEIKVIHYIPSRDCVKAETYLHHLFSDYRLQGDWFDLDKEHIDWITTLDGETLDKLIRIKRDGGLAI